MQIQCMPILKVIFVLSTIVAVTDCCSSRILLLREHTLQIEEHVVQLVQQQQQQKQQQQQLKDSNGQLPTEPDMLFADAGQKFMQMLSDLESELTSIATTERDGALDEHWTTDEESTTTSTTTTKVSTTIATTTTTATAKSSTTTASTSTISMATGEPPPEDTTPQLTTDAIIIDLIKAVPTIAKAVDTSSSSSSSGSIPRKSNSSEEISFRFPCKDNYATDFCLNGGNCYRWANSDSFNYCVCADGFVGERCDSKTEDGVYVPLHPTTVEPQLKTAHVVFSFPMLILLSTIYVGFGAVFMFRNVLAQRRKQQQLHTHKQRFFVSC